MFVNWSVPHRDTDIVVVDDVACIIAVAFWVSWGLVSLEKLTMWSVKRFGTLTSRSPGGDQNDELMLNNTAVSDRNEADLLYAIFSDNVHAFPLVHAERKSRRTCCTICTDAG